MAFWNAGDLFSEPARFVAVRFPGSDRSYDYEAPFPVEIGQRVVVDTRRGEAVVEVVEIKTHSDRATASIKRIAEPAPTSARDRARPF